MERHTLENVYAGDVRPKKSLIEETKMSTLSYTSQCKIIRYWGGSKRGTCLDIIPLKFSTRIMIKSVEEAENIISILKDFVDYKKQGKH